MTPSWIVNGFIHDTGGRDIVAPWNAYAAAAPSSRLASYSRAARTGDIVAVSGTAALDERGGALHPGDAGAQTRAAFELALDAAAAARRPPRGRRAHAHLPAGRRRLARRRRGPRRAVPRRRPGQHDAARGRADPPGLPRRGRDRRGRQRPGGAHELRRRRRPRALQHPRRARDLPRHARRQPGARRRARRRRRRDARRRRQPRRHVRDQPPRGRDRRGRPRRGRALPGLLGRRGRPSART